MILSPSGHPSSSRNPPQISFAGGSHRTLACSPSSRKHHGQQVTRKEPGEAKASLFSNCFTLCVQEAMSPASGEEQTGILFRKILVMLEVEPRALSMAKRWATELFLRLRWKMLPLPFLLLSFLCTGDQTQTCEISRKACYHQIILPSEEALNMVFSF